MISGGRKAAARHAKCRRTTGVRVRHILCPTKAARSPCNDLNAPYCKAAVRMLRNVLLPLKIAKWPHSCTAGNVRCISLSCKFARPSCNAAAVIVNVR